MPPAHAADAAVLRNGERQLESLTPKDTRVLEVLASSDVHPLNESLRSCGSLIVDPGHHGRYKTQQGFFDDARDVFKHLGSAIRLDSQITLFRGVGIPGEYEPDIAGLGEYLSKGTSRHPTFTGDGFGFAATDQRTAPGYDGTGNGGNTEGLFHALFD